MNVVNPLICVLSPRSIDIVKEGHDTFKHVPHLWLKFWSAIQAYHILTDFFLNKPLGKQFTHLVIAPDDLVVKREHYDALVKTLQEEDYPAFSGVCNIDCVHADVLNICVDEVPNIIRKLRRHKWAHVSKVPEGIIKVKFSGMPFMFIRRDIVEAVPLRGDTLYDVNRQHQEPKSFDAAFCWECHQRNIPIHVDTRIKMLHLRGMKYDTATGSQVNNMRTKKDTPKAYFQVNDEIQDFTNHYLAYIYRLNPYDSAVYLKRFVSSAMLASIKL